MENIFYESLLNSIYDGIYYVNNEKKITYWNKAAEMITGYSKDEVVNKCCADNILRHIDESGNELCISGCPLGYTLIDGETRDANVFLHHKSGHRVPVSVRVSPIKNEDNKIIGAIEIFSDKTVDDEKKMELERLKKEVFTDQLTGIANRKYAEMIIKKNLEEQKSVGMSFGMLFIDVDHFKKFNDTYGHKTGDDVLIMVAKTISSVLRNFDSVCRLGGEEFVVILPNIDRAVLEKVSERIRVFIEKTWLNCNDEQLFVTISVGGTLSKVEDTYETVLERADKLMYVSKMSGRNRVTLS